MYNIESVLNELFETLTLDYIKLDGLFINADSGFDSEDFRNTCFGYGIFATMDFNAGNDNIIGNKLLDELLYKELYSTERTNE